MRHYVLKPMTRKLSLFLSLILCIVCIGCPVTGNAAALRERVSVSFDPQGGSATFGITAPKSFSIDNIPFPRTVRTGYAFDGWWTQPAGGKKIDCFDSPYSDQLSESVTFVEDSVLYAHWKETTHSQDVTAPLVTNVTVLNKDVKKPGIVYVRVDFIEEDTGVSLVEVTIQKGTNGGSGSGYQGTFNDGKTHYTGSVVVPVVVDCHAQNGEFKVGNIRIVDQVGNGGSANYEVMVVNEYLINYRALPQMSDLAIGKVFQRLPNGRVVTTETAVNIHDEFDVYMEIALSNPNLISRINQMPEGKTAKLIIDSTGTLPAALFDAIRGKDKRIVAYKAGLQWIIYGKDVVNQSKDVKLNISSSQISGTRFGLSGNLVQVTFEPNGRLPGKAMIRLKSEYLYNLGKSKGGLYLYHQDGDRLIPEEGNFNLHFDGIDKWCYFDVTHNSQFLISGAKITVHSITVAPNNANYGTVTGGGSYAYGTTATVKASPKAGYRFVRWLEGSTTVSTSASCTFKVSRPRALKAEFAKIGTPETRAASAGYNSVKLTWKAVTGASGYVVYRATSNSGAYTLAAVIPSGSTASYTNAGLITGKTYYYKMRAYCILGATKTYGDYSAVVSAKPVPATPTGAKATAVSYNSVKLTWSAAGGAGGYEVWRSTAAASGYKLAAIVAGTSSTSTGLSTGTTYYYKIRAYRTVNGVKVYGSYTTVVSAKPVPAKPTGAKAMATSYNSIKVTWSAVTGAGGYEVWRSATSAGGYKLAALVAGTSSTSTSLATGTTYYFKIRAYRTVNGVRVYGSYSAVVSAKPVLSAATGLKAARVSATSIRLTWYAVSGVTKYEVYRAASASGTYTKLTEVPSAAYTGTGLTTGKTYYYKVRAYRLVAGKKVYGGYSAVVSAKP